MSEILGQPPQGDLPIYHQVEFISYSEWARYVIPRIGRINQLIQPKIAREIARLNNPAITTFLETAIEELTDICQRPLTDQGNPPSEDPTYCILDKSAEGKTFDLNGRGGIHDDATLVAAQILLEALCPEQNINIDGNWQDLLEQARRAGELGYAEVLDADTTYATYTTILPGITVTFSNRSEAERYISLSCDVM